MWYYSTKAFLEARKSLLAAELNRRMEELLHGDTIWLDGSAASLPLQTQPLGGISSDAEEQELVSLGIWMTQQGLPEGILLYDVSDAESGEQRAVFDIAWPDGIQPGLSEPTAVLLNESRETLAIASQAGFRCFTTVEAFMEYIRTEFLGVDVAS